MTAAIQPEQTRTPEILALDFDGVILNGLKEYFLTAWRAYVQIWPTENAEQPPQDIAEGFYRLRPVIESGWEMPMLVRALVLGESEEQIAEGWEQVLGEVMEREKGDRVRMAGLVDRVRDEWIATDMEGWMAIQEFYPGTIDCVREWLQSDLELFIVSTKDGRFIHQLLQQSGVEFPRDRIFGKEVKRPKYETLRWLLEREGVDAGKLWFVEDRLGALKLVDGQADLEDVRLFLAGWGYNLRPDRERARQDKKVRLLDLERFVGGLEGWVS